MTAAAAGVAARTVTGHVSGGVVAGVAVVGHALAAAVWCGTLAALVLTVSSRGQWARLLPVFSRWALWCVVAVLVAGSVAAVASIESPAQLYTTGHGRILLAKVAVTGALLGVAWRNRTRWLEAAQRHRVGAGESVRRAVVELSGGLRLAGLPAWMAWLGLHLFYLTGGRQRVSVVADWVWNYLVWGVGPRRTVID